MIRFLRPFDPHRVRLLVFDLDGTLIDSRLDLIHSVNAMLQHIDRPELEGDVIASYVGDGAPALVRRAVGDTDDEALFRRALEYFLGYYRLHKLDHTTVYEGIAETLASVANSTNGVRRQMAVGADDWRLVGRRLDRAQCRRVDLRRDLRLRPTIAERGAAGCADRDSSRTGGVVTLTRPVRICSAQKVP